MIKIKKIDEAQFEISKLGTEFFKNPEYLYLRSKIFYINKLYYIALDTLLIATEFGNNDEVYKLISKIYDSLGNRELCKKIGYPVLIKASGGGGGKGMKIVNKEEEFNTLFLTAKTEAKKIAKQKGLPVIEGSDSGVKDINEAKSICKKIGYPVLIKASGGGGGKGMKIVESENKLQELFSLARLEAKKYFGNDEVYIEKYFQNPRHIEVQILSGKNRTIHLNERDCSVQRKHQKLIEETPSPVLDEKTRSDLLDKTVKMVEAIGYEGAGTVEYIYENGKFYFLEMNTRVQVEHPVTEVQTGIDIVKEQIWIAHSGQTALEQGDISARGHSIECRINAEDPSKNFQPSPGIISVCHQPSGFRTRVDGSIFQGCKITPYYDSLICKLICKGRNRTEAIQRTLRSLNEFVIDGITTTIDLHKKILSHEKFVSSDFDTNWLSKERFY